MVWKLGLLAVAWCWLVSSALAATIALIPGQGERAPSELAFGQLEARLSTAPEFAWVERQQIRRVLSEHQLNAAGLAFAEGALQLGKWLPADLFVFVERLDHRWRIQIVESRTGIALGFMEENGERLAQDPAPLVAKLTTTLQKWQVPPKERHYVGVLGFRSEEISRALDSPVALLEARFAADLSVASNVVVLDREHLEFLTMEQNLAGVAAELKKSAMLVQFFFKRLPDSDQVQAKLTLENFDHRLTGTNTMVLNTNNQTMMREQLAQAVWDQLKVTAPALGGFDPEKEAAHFANRAQALHLDGSHENAVRAAEAAFALHPIPTYRLRAADLNLQVSAALTPDPGSSIPRDDFGRPKLPGQTKAQVLRYALRGIELYREAVELFLAESRLLPNCANEFPALKSQIGITRALAMLVETGESETLLLRRELQQQCITLFRTERDYYAGLWSCPPNDASRMVVPQSRWEWLVSAAIPKLPTWTDDVDEYAKLLREVVGNYRNPPGPFHRSDTFDSPRVRRLFFHNLATAIPVQQFRSPQERAIILALAESLSRDPDPALRLAGLNQIREFHARVTGRYDPARNRELVEIFLREYPYNHPIRVQDLDFQFPAEIVSHAAANPHLSPVSPERLMIEPNARAILTPILQAKDGIRLCSWGRLVLEWVKALAAGGKREEALLRAQECLELLPPSLPVHSPQQLVWLRNGLSQICDDIAPRQGGLTGEWAGWALDCLGTNAVPYAGLAAAQFQSNRLVTLWARQMGSQWANVQLMAQSLSNGNFIKLGATDVQCGAHFIASMQPSQLFNLDGDMAFLGTSRGGLVVFRDGKARVFSTGDGLPADKVLALASLNGAVYLGFTNGLAVLDLKSGKVTEIASSRSTEQRNPFDGNPFIPLAFLADAEKRCIWMSFGAHVAGSLTPVRGLWKFTPAENKFESVYESREYFRLLTRQNGEIVAGCDWPNTRVMAISPEGGKTTWLTDTKAGLGSKTPLFGLVAERDGCWLWRGHELFTGGTILSRRTLTNQAPATLTHSPDGRIICGMQNRRPSTILALHEAQPGQILFVNGQGELWRLLKTWSATPVVATNRAGTEGMGFQTAPMK